MPAPTCATGPNATAVDLRKPIRHSFLKDVVGNRRAFRLHNCRFCTLLTFVMTLRRRPPIMKVPIPKRRQTILLQHHIQVNANLGATLKQLGWLSWSRNAIAPELDARTQYDIGENDCRPQHPKTAKSYSTTFEAMLNRSI